MVFITEDLLRKRAEHNNCEISTLEEISLHQCDIERIEYIDKWCRELKILYLQSNLIPKIENVSRLKKLEYLNLALNNITVIENLQGCESLNKLDLTVNFIGKVTSIETLKYNQCLRDLYLTGNPCTEFVGYRDYVIAALPQLINLDGKEINKSARITAMQNFTSLRCEMLQQEKKYFKKLDKERLKEEKDDDEGKPGFNKDWYTDTENAHVMKSDKAYDEDVQKVQNEDADFWSKPTSYTPESRIETHRYMEEKRKEKEETKTRFPDPNPPKREIRYFNDEGEPYNINQAQLNFALQEDDISGCIVLNVACYKYLDTSLIDVDIQPTYVRVLIKEKVLQLVLNEEVSPDASTAQRSQTTGHLVVSMPTVKSILSGVPNKKNVRNLKQSTGTKIEDSNNKDEKSAKKINNGTERLEIDSGKKAVDIYNIVPKTEETTTKSWNKAVFSVRTRRLQNDNEIKRRTEEEFVDDPDVPPLE